MNDNNIKPYEKLAIAIVRQAAEDYKAALRVYNRRRTDKPRTGAEYAAQQTIRECERFFRSSYCEMISGVDGDYLIKMIKQELKNEI